MVCIICSTSDAIEWMCWFTSLDSCSCLLAESATFTINPLMVCIICSTSDKRNALCSATCEHVSVWSLLAIMSFCQPWIVINMVSMDALICSVAFEVRPDSALTSSATTAKPRPCSPARAASIAALSASRLVWSAIPPISSINWLTFCAWSLSW